VSVVLAVEAAFMVNLRPSLRRWSPASLPGSETD
jgi:hypothetical protein